MSMFHFRLSAILFAVFVLGVGSVMGATEYANGYTWTYRINGDTAEIYNMGPSPIGNVTIPSTSVYSSPVPKTIGSQR